MSGSINESKFKGYSSSLTTRACSRADLGEDAECEKSIRSLATKASATSLPNFYAGPNGQSLGYNGLQLRQIVNMPALPEKYVRETKSTPTIQSSNETNIETKSTHITDNGSFHGRGKLTSTPMVSESDLGISAEYVLSPEEEPIAKSYLRKADLRAVLFLSVGLITTFLNRTVISFAKINGIQEELGLTGNEYNVALSSFYCAYFVTQIPLSMVLKKIGPRLYIPLTLFFTGAMSLFILPVNNLVGLVLVRLLDGAFQAGFTASIGYMLSIWYPRNFVAVRMGVVMCCTCVGNVFFSVFSIGFGRINNAFMPNWKLFFMTAGLLAMVWGVVGYFLIRDYPDEAPCFNEEEKQLIRRMMGRQNLVASESRGISRSQIIDGITDWRIWMYLIMDFSNNYSANTAASWTLVILDSIGYSKTTSMALLLVPAILSSITVAYSGVLIKKVGKAGYIQIGSAALCIVSVIIGIAGAHSKVARTISVFLLPVVIIPACAVTPSWLNMNMNGTTKSALTNAMDSAAASIGSFVNSYAYLDSDAPLYIKGNASNIPVQCVTILVATLLMLYFKRENKRRDKDPVDVSHLTEDELKELGHKNPNFRYLL